MHPCIVPRAFSKRARPMRKRQTHKHNGMSNKLLVTPTIQHLRTTSGLPWWLHTMSPLLLEYNEALDGRTHAQLHHVYTTMWCTIGSAVCAWESTFCFSVQRSLAWKTSEMVKSIGTITMKVQVMIKRGASQWQNFQNNGGPGGKCRNLRNNFNFSSNMEWITPSKDLHTFARKDYLRGYVFACFTIIRIRQKGRE